VLGRRLHASARYAAPGVAANHLNSWRPIDLSMAVTLSGAAVGEGLATGARFAAPGKGATPDMFCIGMTNGNRSGGRRCHKHQIEDKANVKLDGSKNLVDRQHF